MSKKKVTAIIVTYNRQDLVCRCLDFVLRQTFKVNNIIIVDNASIDNTEFFVKNFCKSNLSDFNCEILTKIGSMGGD